MQKIYFLLFLLLSAMAPIEISAFKSSVKPTVIYDEDNRLDYKDVLDNDLFDGKRSVLAIVYNENIKELKNGVFHIDGKSIGEERQLCSSEAFSKQIAVADCTAFLIAPNIAVTAGHCMNSVQDCKKKKFIQNYAVTSTENMEGAFSVFKENTAYCTEIIAREKNPATGVDYAVLKLDTELESNHYFKLRTDGFISHGAKLTVMGYPSGLPLKYTKNSIVRENSNSFFFQMNADTFGGNSGSPVVDESTGIVEGILVRGERDYELDRNANCYRVKKCASGVCRGEDAVRASVVSSVLSNISNSILANRPSHNINTLPRMD